MSGLTNAIITGQNYADKTLVAITPHADPAAATAEEIATKQNELIAQLKSNGLIKE